MKNSSIPIKIHATIFDNEHKTLCGAKQTIFNSIPAYSFKGKYTPETHCKRCYDKIKTWNNIKKFCEADIVKQEGRY